MKLELETNGLKAAILPDVGAGLAALDLRGPSGWTPLLRRASEGAAWFNDLASYLLAPWSNRIAGGRFSWRGREHRVAPDWPDGTAIHGLIKDKPWRVVQRSPVSAVLECDGPWPCRVGYEVTDNALRTRLAVSNGTPEPMPVGLGFHPYFMRRLWDERDEVMVRYAAAGRYSGLIPTGAARVDEVVQKLRAGAAVSGLNVDAVFAGTANGAEIVWPASGVRVRYECSPNLGHAVLYTEKPEIFCFEPVSMVNDGFNLRERGQPGTGVVELAPGGSMEVEWTMRIERS